MEGVPGVEGKIDIAARRQVSNKLRSQYRVLAEIGDDRDQFTDAQYRHHRPHLAC